MDLYKFFSSKLMDLFDRGISREDIQQILKSICEDLRQIGEGETATLLEWTFV